MVENAALKEEDNNPDKDYLARELGLGQLRLELTAEEDEAKAEETRKSEEAKKAEAEKPKGVPKVPDVPVKTEKIAKEPDWLPEKLKGKTAEDIAKMYLESEKAKTKAEMEASELRKGKEEKPKINADELLEKPEETLRPLIKEVLGEEDRKNKVIEKKKELVYAKAKEEGINLESLTPKMKEIMENPELMPDEMFNNPNANTYLIAYNIAKGMLDLKTVQQAKEQENADEALKAKAALETAGAGSEPKPKKELTPEDQAAQDILDSRSKLPFFETMP